MERIQFNSRGDLIQADLYQPEGPAKGLVVLTGPLTSVKEQVPTAYAKVLAGKGYAAIAMDHRYFGESGGEPRQFENPDAKIEDISAALDFAEGDDVLGKLPFFAIGVCAGAGYMAGAVAKDKRIKAFGGVAGFYHDVDQSREWMGDGFDAQIKKGVDARKAFETSQTVATIPAVGKEGEVAMPMEEAYEFYGTSRGAVPNYTNAFAVQSKEKTTAYDSQKWAGQLSVPFVMVHSEKALAPMLARRFYEGVTSTKTEHWLASKGQIDFYDDPKLIEPAVDLVISGFEKS